MSRKKFITFGGPCANYHNAAGRLCNQTKTLNFFDGVTGYTDIDLKNDKEFWDLHGDFITKNKRGYGFWIWKPYLVQKNMNEIKDGDYLIYADAGCEMNANGLKRLNEYIGMLDDDEEQYGILSFQLTFPEYKYTKQELLHYLNCDEDLKNDNQFIATVVILKKTKHSVSVINKWYEIACNYDLISDIKHMEQDSRFVDHRHDQSILSVLVKKYGSIKLSDETFFMNWDDGVNFPILAKRMRR